MVAPTGQVKILDSVYLLKTAGIIYLHGVMALDIGTCRHTGRVSLRPSFLHMDPVGKTSTIRMPALWAGSFVD